MTPPAPLSQEEWERKTREYESAVAMLQDTGQMIWVINGTYLVATTVLLGALLTQSDAPVYLYLGGGVAGLFLCALWWGSFERNYTFYNYRIDSARILEAEIGFRVLTEGKLLSDGQKVPVGNTTYEMPWPKSWGIQRWTQLLIRLFDLLFVLVAVRPLVAVLLTCQDW